VKERDRQTGEETGETITLFKVVFVFDRSQVEPVSSRAGPLDPPCEPLTGDSHAHLIPPLVAFAGSLGYSVSSDSIRGRARGFCDTKAKRIVVEASSPSNRRLRTLIHETVHALGVDYREYSRARADVIVATTIFWPGRRRLRLGAWAERR